MDAVVDGDDKRRGYERRDDVVRRMEEIDTRLAQRQRDAELLQHGVIAGALDDRLESRAQRPDPVSVGVTAEQHVVVAEVVAGKTKHEVTDVGPDPVVVQLARVDGDAHRHPR